MTVIREKAGETPASATLRKNLWTRSPLGLDSNGTDGYAALDEHLKVVNILRKISVTT